MKQKHKNIAIFVPHAGCPQCCSFCNQRTITAQAHIPDGREVTEICTRAMTEIRDPSDTEIAFFGGSFTAIAPPLMHELLEAAVPFVGDGKFSGIRISTRPDAIDAEILRVLQSYGVTAIELGAQSMCDAVLAANRRGHTAADVERAAALIREYGFSLGLQMMTGLYRSTLPDEKETLRRIIAIHPDTVRIYPTVVLHGTELAALYESGSYQLLPFEEMVEFCASAMEQFAQAGISVIKCGLHPSETVEQERVAGYYHPAFRELCEGRGFRRKIEQLLRQCPETRNPVVRVNPKDVSRATGHKKENLLYFSEMGISVKIQADSKIEPFQCMLEE